MWSAPQTFPLFWEVFGDHWRAGTYFDDNPIYGRDWVYLRQFPTSMAWSLRFITDGWDVQSFPEMRFDDRGMDVTQMPIYWRDGIIGGEKDGPVSPDPVPAGVLLAGHNSVSLDTVGSTLMGFDVEKIPMIRNAINANGIVLPLFKGRKEDIRIIDNRGVFDLEEYKKIRNLGFEPHPNWKDHVEL